MNRHLIGSAFLCALALGFTARAADAPEKAEPYVPGLGDLMTAYVQPHHMKLWMAGEAGNWPLADYEANELGESFEDVSILQGKWHDFPIAVLVQSKLTPALATVQAAVKKQDKAGFKTAFEQLNAACNSCHRATGHAYIAIKTPSGPAFDDQDFKPQTSNSK